LQENDDSAIRRDRERFARGGLEVAVVAAESLREDVAKTGKPGKRICIALDESPLATTTTAA
jgi:hypothetical protein